jgi:very-short-patch-repair endonuclease
MLALHIRAEKLPAPEREYRFHPTRMWRFDFAWPAQRIAVEVEGGVYVGGRHTRGRGFVNDCTKLNAAAAMGYRVFRFPTEFVRNGTAIQMLKEVFA